MVEYIESNVINQYYIYNDNTNRNYKIEYADPNKLYKVHLMSSKNEWKFIYLNMFRYNYYYLKIPWEQDSSLYFYILTDNEELFRNIPASCNFKEWLDIYHNETFLITSLVYQINGIKIIYSINYAYDRIHVVELDPSLEEQYEIYRILRNNCYTIGSGLILLLAYHRIGKVKTRNLYSVLKQWYINYKRNECYFILKNRWSELYYKNVATMIADFPFYYLCFGPNFGSSKIRNIFFSKHDQQLLQYAKEENKLVVANALTAMYPYFNKEIFNNYKRFIPSYVNSYIIDINGYIQSIISTTKSWTYWKKNSERELNEIFKLTNDRSGLIENLLNIAFILYSNRSYDKRKIRELWNILMLHLDCSYICNLLTKAKCTHPTFTFPILFLKDFIKIQNINIFNVAIYNILSRFDNDDNQISYYYNDVNKRIICILCTFSRLDKSNNQSLLNYYKNIRHMFLR